MIIGPKEYVWPWARTHEGIYIVSFSVKKKRKKRKQKQFRPISQGQDPSDFIGSRSFQQTQKFFSCIKNLLDYLFLCKLPCLPCKKILFPVRNYIYGEMCTKFSMAASRW